MPTEVVTYTLANFCDALTHADFTTLVDGVPAFTQAIHWSEEKEPPTNEELKDALHVLAREMIRRSGASTKGEVNTVMAQLSLTLEYPVV